MMKNISLAFALLAALFTTHSYTFDHFDPYAASPTWSTASTAISPTSTSESPHNFAFIQPVGMYNGLWAALCNKRGEPRDNAYFNEDTLRLLIAFERSIQQLGPYESIDTTLYETMIHNATTQMINARIEHAKLCVLCFSKDSVLPQLCITSEEAYNPYSQTNSLENICTGEFSHLLDFESTVILTVGMVKNLNEMLSLIAEKGRENYHKNVKVDSKHKKNNAKKYFIGEIFWSNSNCWLAMSLPNNLMWRSSPWLYCILTQPLHKSPSKDSLFTLLDPARQEMRLLSWIKKLWRTRTKRIAPESSSDHPVWKGTLASTEGDTSLESVSLSGE
jgi:hypothetical protein